MDKSVVTCDLKRRLRKEVSSFCQKDRRVWKSPILETLRELQQTKAEAVFFGGTLRSLLLSRILTNRFGRPRDVDIVVSGTSIQALKERFESIITRETRFGGLQMRRREWHFDLWPLHQTWAFVNDAVSEPCFSELPQTTFFNLESIAVEIWARPGHGRRIFSGNDQFFDGVLNRTIEVNKEENPFPQLCVVRALVMASGLDFAIGPRLANYIAEHGTEMSETDLEQIQEHHYGHLRHYPDTLRSWIMKTADAIEKKPKSTYRLPLTRQKIFWPQDSKNTRITFHSGVTG